MAAYNVFVEGPADSSPSGVDRLAAAIAEHYGLPVDELRARLAKGRFRVKGNCDRETAESYVRDLTQLGARCSVVDSEPTDAAAAQAPVPPRTMTSPLPPRTMTAPQAPRTMTTPLPPRTTTGEPSRPSGSFQSGLSAAFSAEMPAASLGVLADDGGMLKLSSVDGADDPPPAPVASFTPPAAAVSARAPTPKPEAPVDMFAPPDAEAAELKVELASDEVERAAQKRASTPLPDIPAAPTPAPAPTSRISRPLGVPDGGRPSIDAAHSVPAARGLADPKLRFAAGVLVAIVVGFVPAHLLASARERSAYAEIDHSVEETQREAETQEAYDALDSFRAHELARKYDARHNAAILALLVWGVVGGGAAYVWFRRIRWPDGLAG